MTLTEQKKTDDGRISLRVAVAADTFERAVAKEYQKQKGKISIQGFRKGKAPRPVIERMYGEGFFYDDALNGMLPDLLDFALREADADIIGQPQVTVEEIGRAIGAKLEFSAALRPELAVKQYKGMKAVKHIHPVEDADIQKELDSMRERNSRLVTVENRAAESGDVAVIDFEGFVGGKAFDGGKGDNYNLTLGSNQFIPGFEDQISGHSPGESFDVNVTFPDDYGAEHLAGKEAVFHVTLRELRKKELPEPDDEFAKDVSEFDTLDEVKADIRRRIEGDRESQAALDVENQLGDQLAEQLEGEIPGVMIEERIDELVRDFSYRMGAQGLDIDGYLKYTGQDMDAFRGGFRENADKQMRVRLALEAVVRAEQISVPDEDVETEFAKMAENYKMDAEKVRKFIPERDLRKDLEANRALDFVRENAEITEDVHSAREHGGERGHDEEHVAE